MGAGGAAPIICCPPLVWQDYVGNKSNKLEHNKEEDSLQWVEAWTCYLCYFSLFCHIFLVTCIWQHIKAVNSVGVPSNIFSGWFRFCLFLALSCLWIGTFGFDLFSVVLFLILWADLTWNLHWQRDVVGHSNTPVNSRLFLTKHISHFSVVLQHQSKDKPGRQQSKSQWNPSSNLCVCCSLFVTACAHRSSE